MAAKPGFKEHKVMGEFKRGELHSGSSKGPVVKSRAQAEAIAISEAEKAGEPGVHSRPSKKPTHRRKRKAAQKEAVRNFIKENK